MNIRNSGKSGTLATSAAKRPRNAHQDGGAANGRADKEHSILSSAAALFARKGFENTSINEIGAACCLAKPTLYHYFRDKDAIYAGIVLTVLRELCEAVEDEVAKADGPAARLRAYMLCHSRFFDERHAEYVTAQLGYRGLNLPHDRRVALRYRDRHEANLRRIIEAGMNAGVFRRADPATCSRLILSSLNWMVRWYQPGGPQRAMEIAEAYYDLIVNGLGARPAAPAKSKAAARINTVAGVRSGGHARKSKT